MVKLAIIAAILGSSVALADPQPDSVDLKCERQTTGVDKVKLMRITNPTKFDIQAGSLLILDASDRDHVVHELGAGVLPPDPRIALSMPGTLKDPGPYTCTARVIAPGKWN